MELQYSPNSREGFDCFVLLSPSLFLSLPLIHSPLHSSTPSHHSLIKGSFHPVQMLSAALQRTSNDVGQGVQNKVYSTFVDLAAEL